MDCNSSSDILAISLQEFFWETPNIYEASIRCDIYHSNALFCSECWNIFSRYISLEVSFFTYTARLGPEKQNILQDVFMVHSMDTFFNRSKQPFGSLTNLTLNYNRVKLLTCFDNRWWIKSIHRTKSTAVSIVDQLHWRNFGKHFIIDYERSPWFIMSVFQVLRFC